MSAVVFSLPEAPRLRPEDGAGLRKHWRTRFEPVGSSIADRTLMFEELVERHRQPHRLFNNIRRVRALVQLVELSGLEFAAPDVLGLTLWFHNSVYSPTARDNAEQSAALAIGLLPRLGISRRKLERVAAAILATRRHMPTEFSTEHHAFLDLDLAVLGADPTGYGRYRRALRAEFAMVDDDLYKAGRRRMCLTYLSREAIFLTKPLRERFEAHARANLQAELVTL